MRYDCESVRDLLPLHVRGQLLSHEMSAVEGHMIDCGNCAAEATLVRLLHDAPPAVPAGLQQRVLMAVRRPAPRRWAPGRLAMAATVAAALLGGALVLERTGFDFSPEPMPVTLVFEDMSPALSWATGDDPLLGGGAALPDLSLEELELVLAELDS
ncbi:MAG TPA: zf-HC2 domain-containing protein [Longimicrobiales bacterium]|nr:zf-HC2 domain-containing protein [Longimicrobiales bacterium]